MTSQFSITPPPELVWEWHDEAERAPCCPTNWLAVKAAQWGADQELEACCEWLADACNHSLTWQEAINYSSTLRTARRRPQILAEEALKKLRQIPIDPEAGVMSSALDTIRRALERLQELEGGND